MTSTTIQHYRLEDMIGRGGMSEVFRAVDTRLRRSVAIKFMRDTTGEADATVHRFLREARAASALNHPNIVVVYDIGESSDGRPYIVQEFIDGVTLRTLMNEAMPLPTLVEVGRQIARALAAAHTAGIVHRDIKPENVMLRGRLREGPGFRPCADPGHRDGDGHGADARCAQHRTWLAPRHHRLHVAGAGAWRPRGCGRRHFRIRNHTIRDGRRTQAIRRSDDAGGASGLYSLKYY
jgi:serine/threonine protein kinase